MVTTKFKGVRATHVAYDEYLPIWQKCEDLEGGQRHVHKAGPRYLPKLKDEGIEDYRARVARSDFYNAFYRTVSGLTGMAFRKDPITKVPAAIEPMMADVTLSGVSLVSLAKDTVEDVMTYGRIGLMVDHPPLETDGAGNVVPITRDAAERMGKRPSIQTYPAKSIINWRYGKVANRTVLTLVVLKEQAEVEVSEFEIKTEDRYRVLDLAGGFYRQRVFRINDKDEDELVSEVYPLMNGRPMTEIPFRILGESGMTTECNDPPLIDLVEANIAHYQINSDYRHGLHFTGLPTPVISGYAKEEGDGPLYIGSLSAWVFPNPDAKAMFLEFEGKGLDSIKEALEGKEKQMAMLGARMLADEAKSAETLGATQIKHMGENSVLAAIVNGVSEGMVWALGVFAKWAGQSDAAIQFAINNQFLPVAMAPERLRELMAAVQNGFLSQRDLFLNLQQGEVIAPEKTFDEHQREIDEGGGPVRPDPVQEAA